MRSICCVSCCVKCLTAVLGSTFVSFRYINIASQWPRQLQQSQHTCNYHFGMIATITIKRLRSSKTRRTYQLQLVSLVQLARNQSTTPVYHIVLVRIRPCLDLRLPSNQALDAAPTMFLNHWLAYESHYNKICKASIDQQVRSLAHASVIQAP